MNISRTHEITTGSVGETIDFGETIGRELSPGSLVVLKGGMGSGKTVLVKGICRGLGVTDLNEVRSPTFCLCRCYRGRCTIHHVDAFRMTDASEIFDLDFTESFSETILIIEWGDRITGVLPPERLEVSIEITGPESRRLSVGAGNGFVDS